MIKLLRLLMIALLALAIPVQGVAAATMLYCGPDHGPGTDGALTQGHHAEFSARAHAGYGDDAQVRAQSQAKAPVTALVTLSDSPDQAAQPKCSVCAACSNAAAIASPVVLYSPPGAEPVPALKPSPLPYSFITDGPRRPPRLHLA